MQCNAMLCYTCLLLIPYLNIYDKAYNDKKHVMNVINACHVCVVVGNIMTIPGLTTRPGFYDVDMDFSTGKITGLF